MNKEKMVEEFHKAFGHPTDGRLDTKAMQLRFALMHEELMEIKEAIEKQDLPNLLKELCDLQYVLSGTVIAFGFQPVFDDAFHRVHESNMSKAINSWTAAVREQRAYLDKGVNCMIKYIGSDKFMIINKDGKILKPSTYKKVDFS